MWKLGALRICKRLPCPCTVTVRTYGFIAGLHSVHDGPSRLHRALIGESRGWGARTWLLCSIRQLSKKARKANRVHKVHQLYERRRTHDESSDDEFLNYLEKEVTKTYLDKWKIKLNSFLAGSKKEILSTDSKDVKCFHALRYLSKELGLHCQLYWKTLVISRFPLPNYRPDLDANRPQRQVYLTPDIHVKVTALLEEYYRQKKSTNEETGVDGMVAENHDTSSGTPAFFAEDAYAPLGKIIGDAKRGKMIFDNQRIWQESREGKIVLGFRNRLPAYKCRMAFLEALGRCQFLIISGETGCGKTTQLPQYILESQIDAGCGSSCNIICTQPRRISASSVAHRVAEERGEALGETVGYQVRFEAVRSRGTNLLFCTTGILLRRLMSDPVLNGVTHVIVDEIHERGLNEDFLLIVMKDVLQRRPDLKLILMSATVDAQLFQSYFPGSSILQIPGFAFPVKSYFLEDALRLTGYKLNPHSRMWNYLKKPPEAGNLRSHLSEGYFLKEAVNLEDYSSSGAESIDFNLVEQVLLYICRNGEDGAVLVFMTGWEDISSLRRQLRQHPLLGNTNKVLLLGCHGTMSAEEQKRIFERPPPNVRKIVLSTNIAETSITIDDVVYVVDIGKAKEKSYDVVSNTACLLPKWISKAAARQRRGRAGRIKPGVCYHLYPESVYEAFDDHNQPEILRAALHNVCLRIKGLQLGGIKEFLAKAIQPPDSHSVHNAVEFLKTIGALNNLEELTVLGRHLSMLPVEPQIGKMLIMGCVFQCLDPILTIAAGLSSRDPFVVPVERREDSNEAKFKFSVGEMSDHVALVRAYNDWELCMKHNTALQFCRTNYLSMQALMGMASMRRQFMGLLKDAGFLDEDMANCDKYSSDPMIVRAVICAGLFPGVAAVVATPGSIIHKTLDGAEVLIHPHSVNARQEETGFPWLLFLEKIRTSNVFIRDSTGVSDSILLLFGGPLTSIGQPGHLQMCGKCLEFYFNRGTVDVYRRLRRELDDLIRLKLEKPEFDIYKDGALIMNAVLELIRGDVGGGQFVYGRKADVGTFEGRVGGKDAKLSLYEALLREGIRRKPLVSVKRNKAEQFVAKIEFRGLRFIGEPDRHKKQAERNACSEAAAWLSDPANAEKKKTQLWGGAKVSEVRIRNAVAFIKKLRKPPPPAAAAPEQSPVEAAVAGGRGPPLFVKTLYEQS